MAGVNNKPSGPEDPVIATSDTRPRARSRSTSTPGSAPRSGRSSGHPGLDKITIAAVNGFAIQLGLSIALACDFAIAASSRTLGSATLRMGWQPDEGGHWLLVEHLGVKRALEFLLRKEIVAAEDASALGLVNEVVPDAN